MEKKDLINEKLNPYSVNADSILPQHETRDMGFAQMLQELGAPEELLMGAWARVKEDGEIEIAYPSGDVYLSTAIIIHELGHLRQDEYLTTVPEHEKQVQKERDAQERGLKRFRAYAPDFLDELNERFNAEIRAGEIQEFASFDQLYEFLNEVVNIKINQAILLTDSQEGQLSALKKQGLQEHFERLKKAKVGSRVNEAGMNELILKIVQSIINE